MKEEMLTLIRTRRSFRRYRDDEVPAEVLQAVLEAGTYAPTAHGLQTPYIVAVRNKAMRQRLSSLNAQIMGVKTDPYYGAPVFVLVFDVAGDPNGVKNGSCVLQNMMLAAHALGLGSCWINREAEMFATPDGVALMREFGLPDGLAGIGALALGYPEGESSPQKSRKENYYRIID